MDDRIHATHLGLCPLYAELELELEALVLPYLDLIPADTAVVLIADHGFTCDPRRDPPYAHGGATPFERVVPCAVFDRKTGGSP